MEPFYNAWYRKRNHESCRDVVCMSWSTLYHQRKKDAGNRVSAIRFPERPDAVGQVIVIIPLE